jgi:hypothetical protein
MKHGGVWYRPPLVNIWSRSGGDHAVLDGAHVTTETTGAEQEKCCHKLGHRSSYNEGVGFEPLTAEQERRTSGSFKAVGSAGHLRVDQVGRIMASIDVSNTGSTRDEACAVPDETGYDHDELASDRDHICGLSATQFHKTKSSLDRCQQ